MLCSHALKIMLKEFLNGLKINGKGNYENYMNDKVKDK